MKIFGNRKRRPSSAAPRRVETETVQRAYDAPQTPQPEREASEPAGRLSPTARGVIWLLASLVLFAATVAVCLTLNRRSL